ncbi:serine protease [Rhizobium leguminosarum]|uniref:serine protease n=1 Tax=Rhizobium leguminosarum TaxID=384 RepID=UPI0021BBDEE7|nr:serine protease [Rhizobium leguminosarum]
MVTVRRSILSAFFSAALASTCLADAPTSSGTGFAVTPDGWLLTNAHVVQGCKRIEIKGRGDAADPRIDATNDLALVRIDAANRVQPLVFRLSP